jgi:hypothetical protein
MAHGDYDCCAVCDSKLSYSNDPSTKETLCSSCAVNLAQRGIFVHGVAELTAWMKSAKPATVVSCLDAVGFKSCVYGNEIDDLYEAAKASHKGRGAP